MAIVAMRHLRLIGLQSEREEMLRRLQHLGCLEITEPEPAADDPLLEKLRIPEAAELQRIREQYTAAEQALQTLAEHTPKEKTRLEPLPTIAERALTEPTELANGRDAAGRLNEYRSELTALQSRSEKLAAEEAQLLPWESLTMPLECATTEKVLIQMGTLPAAVLPQQIHETLDAAGDLYELREVSADREHRYMVLTVHISQAEDHIAALKALGWSRVTLGERTGTAAANLSALRQEQTELAEKRALLEEAIIQCAGQKPELRQLSDASRIEIDRGEAKSRTRDTAETFLLEGWFPAENTKELEMLLEGCLMRVADDRPGTGGLSACSGQAEEQSLYRSAEYGHGDVFAACLWLAGSKPLYGTVFYLVLRDYDGRYGLRAFNDGGIASRNQKETAHRRQLQFLCAAGIMRHLYFLYGCIDRRFLRGFHPANAQSH